MSDRRNRPIVTEDAIHDAMDYIMNSTDAAAEAAGTLERADYNRKIVRARLVLEAPHTTMGMREAWAEAQERYEVACYEHADAKRAVEWHRNMRSKCEALFDMFRTLQATQRVLGRVA
jgi:hypothetical protein